MPQRIQTDNSSAATKRLGITSGDGPHIRRDFTRDYLHLVEHYGLEPQTTHTESPNENADVESANGALKRALKQELLLRGSRNFADLEGYEQFLFGVMDKRNKQRKERLVEEIAVMKPLKATPLANSVKDRVRVSSGSLIRVLKKSYSVPTSLIGKKVTVYVHEWSLDVYYAGQLVETLPVSLASSHTTSIIGTSSTRCCASQAAFVAIASGRISFPSWFSARPGSS